MQYWILQKYAFLTTSLGATLAVSNRAGAMFWACGCLDFQVRSSKRRRKAPATSKAEAEEAVVAGLASQLDARRAEEKLFVQQHDTDTSDTWYLISTSWLDRWKAFASGRAGLPGPITNEALVRADGSPLPGKQPTADYRGVTGPALKLMASLAN